MGEIKRGIPRRNVRNGRKMKRREEIEREIKIGGERGKKRKKKTRKLKRNVKKPYFKKPE